MTTLAPLLIALSSLAPLTATDPPHLRELTLEGTAYERGLQHGTELRADIHAMLAAFEADLERGHGPVAGYRSRFLAGTSFDDAIRRWCPDLLDEVRGIAAGAGVDFERLFAFQLIDEHWSQGAEFSAHRCTSFAVAGNTNQPSIVAQNLDIPPFFHPYPLLLRIRDAHAGTTQLVVTVPGLVGANGVSSSGIAVCVNTLMRLLPAKDGLPVAFVVRRVLQSGSLDEAERFLRSITHASGQNYLLGDAKQVLSLECSAHQQHPFWPHESRRFTYHTNHAVENPELRPRFLSGGASPWNPAPGVCERFDVLAGLYTDPDAPLRVDDVKAALSNRDGRRVTIDNSHTFCCTVTELSSPPRLHLCVGRPQGGSFRTLLCE